MAALKGQVVVVTGAGTGIGRATALHFAEHGATVIANGRRADKLEETAALASAMPGEIVAVAADVGTEQGAQTVLQHARAAGDFAVLVNNAGVGWRWCRTSRIDGDHRRDTDATLARSDAHQSRFGLFLVPRRVTGFPGARRRQHRQMGKANGSTGFRCGPFQGATQPSLDEWIDRCLEENPDSPRVTLSPCLLECTGRNASVTPKLPGQVSLVGETQIKGDQR